MTHIKKRRENVRYQCAEPVVILRETTRMFSSVMMKNFSDRGLYFEASDPLDIGDFLSVRTDEGAIIDLIQGPGIRFWLK